MTVSRERLLALKPGDELRDGGMRAYKPHPNPRNPLTERILYFSKRFLEGKLTYACPREFVEDVLDDPWELISQRLAESAVAHGAHHLDGSLVTIDD
jgi:hypothetical protein